MNSRVKKCNWCGSVIELDPDQTNQSEAYCINCIDKFKMTCPACRSVATFHQEDEDRSSSYFDYYCTTCKGTWYNTDVLEFKPDGSMFFIRYRDNAV